MLDLTAGDEGVILPVHAQPGAKQNAITGVHAGRLKVSVTQAPEQGKANQALIRVLADLLGLKRAQLQLLSGATSSQKRFHVRGVSVAELQARIGPYL